MIDALPLVVSAVSLTVSLASYFVASRQAKIAADQLSLRLIEARPYVKIMPHFSVENGQVSVLMANEDLTSIPAKIFYDRMTPAFDGRVSTAWVQSRPGQHDILYEHRGGGATLPPIEPPLATDLLQQRTTLRLGTCAVYGTLSDDDHRYWEVDAVYEFRPGENEPLTLDTSERLLRKPDAQCDPAPMMTNWIKQHGPGPTPLVAGFGGSKRGEVPYTPPQ